MGEQGDHVNVQTGRCGAPLTANFTQHMNALTLYGKTSRLTFFLAIEGCAAPPFTCLTDNTPPTLCYPEQPDLVSTHEQPLKSPCHDLNEFSLPILTILGHCSGFMPIYMTFVPPMYLCKHTSQTKYMLCHVLIQQFILSVYLQYSSKA